MHSVGVSSQLHVSVLFIAVPAIILKIQNVFLTLIKSKEARVVPMLADILVGI